MSIAMVQYRRLPLFCLFALAMAATISAEAQQSIDKVLGSITAQAGQAYGSLETVNGGITVQTGATTKGVSTVNGSISVADQASTGDLETVNGSIKLGKNVTAGGHIETVNGAVFIDRGGKVRKGIETVNGSIGIVATDVSGDIQSVNANITVGDHSHVHGGIKIEKNQAWQINKDHRQPRIIIGPNAVVDGPLVFERPVQLYVHSSAKVGPITGASPLTYSGDTAPGQ